MKTKKSTKKTPIKSSRNNIKKLFTLLALVITITTFAQAPQGFNYQATVRNSSGALIVNQNVYFKFNLMLNSVSSVPVFSETHYTPTDDLGQVNLVIGTGTATTGSFSTINWGTGNYYLGIEINTGSGYVAMGTTQLLSVPYALYANSSGNSNFNFPNGTNIGDTLNWKWNGSAWIPTSSVSTAQLPVIATTVATNTLSPSPSSGGTITSDGGYSITSKGVCWSTSPNPTINDNSTNNGTGASNFTSILPNLLPITTYYYRAYATNSIGTAYGITYTFTTAANPEIVSTIISEVKGETASSEVLISSDGGATIIAKGVCWSTSPNPTTALSTKTNNGTGTATFKSDITGLTGLTTYYVRAYATNSFGTSYGAQVSFTTLASTIVTIGTQTWTIKNLEVATYSDGTVIPEVKDPNAWINLTTGAWCYLNNDAANGTTYGKLYNWYAVVGIWNEASKTDSTKRKKLAPSGYHIPTEAEWRTLTTFLTSGNFSEGFAGGKMKETGTTHWKSPNSNATNSSQFTGLPGGWRDYYGNSSSIGSYGHWWSLSEHDIGQAKLLYLYYWGGNETIAYNNKYHGLSVRCLRD